MEEQLKKLLTGDPSVVESSLEKYSEAAHPEKTSVLCRFVFLKLGDTKILPFILIIQLLTLLRI